MPPSVYSPRWTPSKEEQHPDCDMPGCEKPGEHRAPKSRYSPIAKDYYRFCQAHAGEYNKQWNYFDGMSEMEIEIYWDNFDTDHRPTWAREKAGNYTADKLYESFTGKFGDVFNGSGATVDEMAARIPAPNSEVTKALRFMELDWPVTKDNVKVRFKELVKKYHPDVNKEATAEDRFKRVTESYAIIMTAVDEH
ncbi:MAG: DnaJ domain-containing protein [Rickettsiales bacterium]|nr:DnaJ domain-containing protein [Rickettsiales bacterium]